MAMKIFILLIYNYIQAAKGWLVFHNVVHKFQRRGTEYVVLFPESHNKCSYYTLLYLDKYLEKHYANRVIVLTVDDIIAKAAPLFSKRIRKIVKISMNNSRQLLQYYQLCPFDQRFLIASLSLPEGRDGLELVGKHDITLEELIVIGLLGFSEFRKLPYITYAGEDQEIADFFSCVKNAEKRCD